MGGDEGFLGYFKMVAEPGLVASILITGIYINRIKHRRRLEGENRVSYLLNRYPFIMEVVYWLLTYWVYQICRAVGMVILSGEDGKLVTTAKEHAVSLINLEKKLGIFHELDIQRFFMAHPFWLGILNRVYSYIHIPGTVTFFVWFYYTQKFDVYAPVRRAMTLTNMIAFTIFTLWPCAPPRFLNDYGFVDTVHANGNASIWTTNKFCNQYAAVPSMHFGYSFFIGLNIFKNGGLKSTRPMWQRLLCCMFGLFYPLLLLTAIVATGNHFFLDALVGGLAILLGFACNRFVLVLWPLQVKLFKKFNINMPMAPSDYKYNREEEVEMPLLSTNVAGDSESQTQVSGAAMV
jgi:hypothetical protein